MDWNWYTVLSVAWPLPVAALALGLIIFGVAFRFCRKQARMSSLWAAIMSVLLVVASWIAGCAILLFAFWMTYRP